MENAFFQALSYIYNATYVPIHYYKDSVCLLSFPVIDMPTELASAISVILGKSTTSLYHYQTEEGLHIGYVGSDLSNEAVVVGPVSSMAVTDEFIDAIILKYGVSIENKDKIREFFVQTPEFSIIQFLNILAMINKELTGNYVDIYETFNLFDREKEAEVGESHSNTLYERKETENFHDTYFFEQEYYGYVERGDIAGLEAMIRNIPRINEGKVAPDSLRQAKNIFIASMALVTRHSISGGLDIETAYQLSDMYIQEAERMSDASSVTLLNATAVMDFTKRVAESKIPQGMETDIYMAIQYIANHVNQNISVEDVAAYLGIDRSTLSRKFKRELGFNISSYIMRRKLEEAKSLLKFTDKSISEISEYLCFSTQSYFQNVFKKKYGMTPKEFRNN